MRIAFVGLAFLLTLGSCKIGEVAEPKNPNAEADLAGTAEELAEAQFSASLQKTRGKVARFMIPGVSEREADIRVRQLYLHDAKSHRCFSVMYVGFLTTETMPSISQTLVPCEGLEGFWVEMQ